MLRFVREMIAFRKRHACLRRRRFLAGRPAQPGELPDIVWHGYELDKPVWHDPQARLLAFTLAAVEPGAPHLHAVLNMSEHAHQLVLPELAGRGWYRAIDTAQASPADILAPPEQQPVETAGYPLAARSVVVLEGRQLAAPG
jgi:glycogen operon protein